MIKIHSYLAIYGFPKYNIIKYIESWQYWINMTYYCFYGVFAYIINSIPNA